MIAWWIALATAADPGLALQEARVADAAAAVAQARHDGARPARVAELMGAYRTEAERLAALQGPADPGEEARVRESAARALADAAAAGREDAAARAVVDAWLGGLEARLTVLQAALVAAQASPDPLGASIAADVRSQATVVGIAATYDASLADQRARKARTEAAALAAGVSPLERPSLATEQALDRLQSAAVAADADAAALRGIATRAAALRDQPLPEEP